MGKLNEASVLTAREPATQHTLEFVQAHAPAKASILEVGCGQGDLALALTNQGYKVTAIDINPHAVKAAKAKGVKAKQMDFFDMAQGSFDVVLFTSSLHHLDPLKSAVDLAHRLMKPSGMLLVEDFALEAPNGATLKWNYGLPTAIQSMVDGVPITEELALNEAEVQERWRAEHNHQPPLHSGARMVEEAKRFFEILLTERGPYLYRSLIKGLEHNKNGVQAVQMAKDWEADLISKQSIRPVGLRIVALPL